MACMNKKLLATWAILECLFFSGSFFGWGSLVFVLKGEGLWEDLCELPHNGTTNATYQIPEYNHANVTKQNNGYNVYGTSKPDEVIIGDNNNDPNEVGFHNSSQLGHIDEVAHPCVMQDDRFTLAFTIGSVSMNFGVFVVGQINFKFGMRAGRIVSMLIYIMGVLGVAFVDSGREWLLFIGAVGLPVGGISLLVSNAQITSLFAKGGSILMGLMSGSTDSSVISMLLVKILYENGVSRMYSFIFFVSLFGVMTLFSTFILLPKGQLLKPNKETEFELSVENNAGKPWKPDEDEQNSKFDQLIPGKGRPGKHKPERTRTLKTCLFSGEFIFHAFWHFLLQFRFMYFMGTINPLLNHRLNNDHDKVSHFTNVGFYTLMSGIIFSLLSGMLYDWQIRSHKNHANEYVRQLKPSVLPLAVTCTLATLMSVVILIPTEELIYITFILVAMYRSILYTMSAAYIIQVFPMQYFSALYGVCVMVSGVLNFLQYAVFMWNESYPGAPEHVNIFFLGAALLSFSHPIYQFVLCHRKNKSTRI